MAVLQAAWIWIQNNDWDHYSRLAPIVTALIAFAALLIALSSLKTQKQLARKKSAIDFFLKSEMDGSMLAAYKAYQSGLVGLSGIASLAELTKDQRDHYEAVRMYLDVVELMSIGVVEECFDEEVCYGFWYSVVTRAAKDCKRIIDYARSTPEGAYTYSELLKIDESWRRRAISETPDAR